MLGQADAEPSEGPVRQLIQRYSIIFFCACSPSIELCAALATWQYRQLLHKRSELADGVQRHMGFTLQDSGRVAHAHRSL